MSAHLIRPHDPHPALRATLSPRGEGSRLIVAALLPALPLLCLPATALAGEPVTPTPPPDPLFVTDGEARLIASLPPDATLDTEGTQLDQGFVLDSRLRAGAVLSPGAFKLKAEFDLFDGQIAGDAWGVPGIEDARHREEVDVLDGDSLSARQLSIGGRIGPAMIEGGLMTSHWGLGMLANDGAHDPYFGRDDFGDRVLRLRTSVFLSKMPVVALTLAGDRVVEDEQATWTPLSGGQAAWQGVGALSVRGEAYSYGIYGVYRHQTEVDGRVTSAGVLDLYADQTLTAGPWWLRLAAEAAGILGHTERAQSYNSRGGLAVRSAGATGLVAARYREVPVTGTLRAGWASGDGDPDDGYARDFSFDRDFDVGMVLFDELQGAIDAAAFAQLSDPAHSGGAPDGAESLVGEGAARRMAFLQPILSGQPRPWLRLSGGVSLAWATAPIAQPFATYRNGGVPANHLGQPTEGYRLGTEFDWAMEFGDEDAPLVRRGSFQPAPSLLLQGGHLRASPDLGGGVYSLVTLTGRVRW